MARTLTTLLLVVTLLFKFESSHAAPTQSGKSIKTLGFLENKGQVTDQFHHSRPDIDFKVAAESGMNIFIGSGAIHYEWARRTKEGSYTMYRMDVKLLGANPDAEVIREKRQDFHFSYSLSHAKAKAYSYGKITYKDVYPKIDWVWYINEEGKLEHDFVVHPGGNPRDIRIKYEGSTGLQINQDESLTAGTPFGNIAEAAPYAYEQRSGNQVTARYVLDNDVLSFETAAFNGTLVIDPTVEWATYFGGLNRDWGKIVAVDKDGNVIMAGETESIDDIATTGAHQTEYAGGVGDWGYASDAFITKFNLEGVLQWASYFGGENDDVPVGLTTDTAGNVFMSGWTLSSGISTTGSYQEELAGEDDAFVAKFNTDGELIWSTYYGGEMFDNLFGGGSMYCDGSNLYLSGTTMSETGIATEGAWQEIPAGNFDAFIAKFDNDGAMHWGTYFGGGDDDRARAIAGLGDSVLYIAGFTNSTSGIATDGAFQESNAGGMNDAFVARFDGDGNLVWSSYFGGADFDKAEAVACDADYVYISGVTLSTTSIATAGAHQEEHAGGEDVFIAQFAHGGSLNWATYYGGSANDRTLASSGMAVDGIGNLYITGQTASSDGIITDDAIQEEYAGTFDAFISKFSSSGALQWGTYYGGTSDDLGYSVVTNGAGMLYLSGITSSATGIATDESYQTIQAGGEDAFLLVINDCAIPVTPDTILGTTIICSGAEQIYTVNQVADAVSYTWILPEGWSGESSDTSISVTANSLSGYIKVVANGLCANSDTFSLSVIVSPAPVLNPSGDTAICAGSMLTIVVTEPIEGAGYIWLKDGVLLVGETGSMLSMDNAGNYQVVAEHDGCIDTSSLLTVSVNPVPTPIIVREGMLLSTTETYSTYQWNFENTPIVGAVGATHTITLEGNYTVTVTDENGCQATSDIPTDLGTLSLLGDISIYPNPSTGSFTLLAPRQGSLTICTTDGRLVKQGLPITQGNNTMDVADLPAGIYWLHITDKAGTPMRSHKLVKSE